MFKSLDYLYVPAKDIELAIYENRRLDTNQKFEGIFDT
jgi:hypothetical protein